MFKENRLGFFLSFSFILHFLILVFFSFFLHETQNKEISVIEVSLLKINSTGSVLGKTESASRPKMMPSAPFSLRNNKENLITRLSRSFKDPDYVPSASEISKTSEKNIKNPNIESQPRSSGFQDKSKAKSSSVPGKEMSSGYAGSHLGVEGPAGGRRILYFEYPSYPEWAEKKGIQAKIELKFWVSEEGYVEDVIVVKKGYIQLDNLAVQALKKWRFEPVKGKRQWGIWKPKFELK